MCYCGYLEVQEIKDCFSDSCCGPTEPKLVIGYKLILGIHAERHKPLVIMYGGNSEKDFLKYVAKELRNRYLHFTKYFRGYMVPSDNNGCSIC
jgi:hypothetical protein